MNGRQRYAFDHPLNSAGDRRTLEALTEDRRLSTGLFVRTILAVDR